MICKLAAIINAFKYKNMQMKGSEICSTWVNLTLAEILHE